MLGKRSTGLVFYILFFLCISSDKSVHPDIPIDNSKKTSYLGTCYNILGINDHIYAIIMK